MGDECLPDPSTSCRDTDAGKTSTTGYCMPTPLPWPRAGLYRVSLAFTPSTLTTNNYGPNIDPGYITWKHVTYSDRRLTVYSFVTSNGQVSGSAFFNGGRFNWVGTYDKNNFDYTREIPGYEWIPVKVHHVGTLQQEDYQTWTLSGTWVHYLESSSYSMTMIGSPSSLGTVCSATPLTIRSRDYLILAFCGKT